MKRHQPPAGDPYKVPDPPLSPPDPIDGPEPTSRRPRRVSTLDPWLCQVCQQTTPTIGTVCAPCRDAIDGVPTDPEAA